MVHTSLATAIASQNNDMCRRNINILLTNILVRVLRGLPQPVQARLVSLVIAVGEVESSDVHARLDERLELRHLPACWTEGAYDFRAAVRLSILTLDGREVDEPAG